MTAFLCPFFGAGYQSFTNQGVVNAGGKLYTYLAGSSTLANTWTASNQGTLNSNPITLDSAGRPPQELWVQTGTAVKVIVTDPNLVQIGPAYDNISGAADSGSSTPSQWVASGLTPTLAGADTFTVLGNQTSVLHAGRRLQFTDTTTIYGTIISGTFGGGGTTVVMSMDTLSLSSSLSAVNYSLLSAINHAIPLIGTTSAGVFTPTLFGVTNVTTTVAHPCSYARVGDRVMGSLFFEATNTSASVLTQIRLSLPVASNFTTLGDCAGVGTVANGSSQMVAAIVYAYTSPDNIVFEYIAPAAVQSRYHFATFTYVVQ